MVITPRTAAARIKGSRLPTNQTRGSRSSTSRAWCFACTPGVIQCITIMISHGMTSSQAAIWPGDTGPAPTVRQKSRPNRNRPSRPMTMPDRWTYHHGMSMVHACAVSGTMSKVETTPGAGIEKCLRIPAKPSLARPPIRGARQPRLPSVMHRHAACQALFKPG